MVARIKKRHPKQWGESMWRYDVTFPVNHTGVKLGLLAVCISEVEVPKAERDLLIGFREVSRAKVAE